MANKWDYNTIHEAYDAGFDAGLAQGIGRGITLRDALAEWSWTRFLRKTAYGVAEGFGIVAFIWCVFLLIN